MPDGRDKTSGEDTAWRRWSEETPEAGCMIVTEFYSPAGGTHRVVGRYNGPLDITPHPSIEAGTNAKFLSLIHI